MKPIRVAPGEHSEYETMLKRATDLEKAIDDGHHDVKFEDVSGTNVRAQHFWTNQELPDTPETVAKEKAIVDNSPPGLGSAVPHQYGETGSTLGSHMIGSDEKPTPLRKSSQLFGAWKEDNPFSINEIVDKVEELARHL